MSLNILSSMDPSVLGGDFVNPRTFELAGLGCFQLTDQRSLLPLHYHTGTEIVQFKNEKELRHLARHFLKNDGERRRIAQRARQKTFDRHLYEHRIVEMLTRLRAL